MNHERILISGGGVAGYTMAYWLHHYGFQPMVIEQSARNQRHGYGIEFIGTGWDIADKMGLVPKLEEQRIHVNRTIIKNVDGKTTAEMDLRALYGEPGSASKVIGLDRSDLVRVLFEAIEDTVDVRFSTSIEQVSQSSEAIVVTYVDGSTQEFDLLIGADGFRSNVRRIVFGPAKQFSQFLDYYTAAFYLPNDGGYAKNSVMYLEPDLQATVLPRDDARLLVNVTYKEPVDGHFAQSERKAAIASHVTDSGWLAREVLSHLSDETPIFLDTMGQIEMPSWPNERVALIGDAAYCMSALSGQGTSMAMAGAYMLAEELSQHDDFRPAFVNYERRLRPPVEDTQRKAKNVASSFVPNSNLKIFLLTSMMKMLNISWVAKLARSQFNVASLFDTGVIKVR